MANSSASAPAVSTPVGPPPTTTKVSSPSADRRPVGVGRLEALDDVVPQPHGVGQRVEREAVLGRAGRAEVGDRGAAGQHEVVERAAGRGRRAATVRAVPVDAGDRRPAGSARSAGGGTGPRTTWATSAAFRPAVATWYRSGWKVWKLLRSTSVMSTGRPARRRATSIPPNPAPTTTTLGTTAMPATLPPLVKIFTRVRRGGPASGRSGTSRCCGPGRRAGPSGPGVPHRRHGWPRRP